MKRMIRKAVFTSVTYEYKRGTHNAKENSKKAETKRMEIADDRRGQTNKQNTPGCKKQSRNVIR
jgi:hypothetical protein